MTVSVSCYKNQTLFTRPTPPLSTPLFAYRRTHPSHPPPPPQKPAHAHSTTDSLLWALRQPTQQQQFGDEKKESEKKKDRERNGVRVHRATEKLHSELDYQAISPSDPRNTLNHNFQISILFKSTFCPAVQSH